MFKLIGFFSLILATTNGASFISAELEVTLKLSPQAQNEENGSEVSVFKTLEKEIKQDCPGPECLGGCCPHVGWVCCPGGEYCAASNEYCSMTTIAEKMILMAAPKKVVKQDCPGPECPGGCCQQVGWFCCPNGESCAASEE